MMEYCLLCNDLVNNPGILHKSHRYSKYWIEYFSVDNCYQIKTNLDDYLIIALMTSGYKHKKVINVSKECFILFKGLYNYNLAKPIIDKLKVFE